MIYENSGQLDRALKKAVRSSKCALYLGVSCDLTSESYVLKDCSIKEKIVLGYKAYKTS